MTDIIIPLSKLAARKLVQQMASAAYQDSHIGWKPARAFIPAAECVKTRSDLDSQRY